MLLTSLQLQLFKIFCSAQVVEKLFLWIYWKNSLSRKLLSSGKIYLHFNFLFVHKLAFVRKHLQFYAKLFAVLIAALSSVNLSKILSMYIIHDFKVSETHQRLVVELDDIQDSPESEQTERGEICQMG